MTPQRDAPGSFPARPLDLAWRALFAAFVLSATAGCSAEKAPPRIDLSTIPYFQRLTNTPEAETSPAFSPDGARLVYERSGEIWVMEVASRASARAALHGNDPSWSPDGGSIVFVRRDVTGPGLIHRLVRLQLSSGAIDTVSSDTVDVYEPAAAPVGTSIALRNLSRVNRLQSLRVVRVDGTDVATLTRAGSWVDTSPAWSLDGLWITFVRLEDSGIARLMRVLSDGDAAAVFIAGETSGASGPTWYPDGRIFFSRSGVISWIAASGGPVTPFIVGAGFELAPTVSPDGRRIVFTTDRTGNPELWMLVDPAGLGPGPYSY